MASAAFTWTESKFATRKDAQDFANLRSMVDLKLVKGPYIDGDMFVVYVAN